MKPRTVYFILLICYFLKSTNGFGQYNKLLNPVPKEYSKEIAEKYADPNCPKFTGTRNKFDAYDDHEQALKDWPAKQEPFPKFINTGKILKINDN